MNDNDLERGCKGKQKNFLSKFFEKKEKNLKFSYKFLYAPNF